MRLPCVLACMAILGAGVSSVWGAIRIVRTGATYSTVQAAVNAAINGDTLEIESGTYYGSTGEALISKSNLTFRGVGATRPILDAGGLGYHIQGKAIWVIQGSNTTVENIEFYNCKVPDENGAGIRQEGNHLTVGNCYFHDNENALLGGGGSSSDVLFEYCELDHNGDGVGYAHNIYIGNIRTFTFRHCWTHRSWSGHLIKTRASTNYILYNRITGEEGTGSYEVNVPNGGTTYIIGNLVQQGPNTENSTIIDYGSEGLTNPDQHLYVVNNTIVNERNWGTVTFVRNYSPTAALLQNNIFQGYGTVVSGPATQITNWVTNNAFLQNQSAFNYHLTASSTGAINMGTAPGTGINGFAMTPLYQYVHPYAREARPTDATIDIGAYEFVPPNQPPTVSAGPDQNTYEGNPVALHATASDPDLDPLSYAWSQTAGLAVALAGANTADASFTAPTVASAAEAGLTFRVDVSDGRGGQANDSVNVRVYLRGDVDHGDSVDIFDVIDTVNAFGTSSGDPGYNANADFDGNGTVDIFDVIDVVGNFGRTIQ